MATTAGVTADQLWEMGEDSRFELIEGELIPMSPAGGAHGEVGSEAAGHVWAYVREHRLGRTYTSDTGFRIGPDPDTVLCPDAAFVARERLPPANERVRFMPLAPDWAVEVVSPSERPTETLRKAYLYLSGGVRLLWVVYPDSQTVTVYTQDQPPRVLTENDTLDGENVLPGFTLPVRALFEE